VDTLDNTGALKYKGQQVQMFGFSSENASRIKRQNEKKISVIIGNPPYNANQLNENENNKNREYPSIDKRIKDTYIKESTAQKTKLYDMYARFLRWASDRVDKNGIVAFVSNNSFIDSGTYDGFRKIVGKEFNEIWIIDLKGNARHSGERRKREAGNVFDNQIRVGIAIYFLVKKVGQENCEIYYNTIGDYKSSLEKKQYLEANRVNSLTFEKIKPINNNWINLADNDFDSLLPIANKETKAENGGNAIFRLYSCGVVTARDEWVYDFNKINLEEKVKYFCKIYKDEKTRWRKSNKELLINNFVDRTIKWTEELEAHLKRGDELNYSKERNTVAMYRPFVKQLLYFDKIITHRIYQNDSIFGIQNRHDNKVIYFSGINSSKPFSSLVLNLMGGFDLLEKTQCLPLYRFNKNGERIENITDWGLEQFKANYKDKKIKKEDIFHYVYGVLHNPAYRKKYELNLKREFPRIPFYKDFWKWAKRGKELMKLHINYEKEKPFSLKRIDIKVTEKKPKQKEFFPKVKEPEPMFGIKPKIKVKLRADKTAGTIEIDDITTLKGVPKEAWDYKLGNRSAIEWILDQYKEKKPKDPTIAEKFNSYRFADHKEEVIELIRKVTTVSMGTMEIISRMGSEIE
jgi:predicted helicase